MAKKKKSRNNRPKKLPQIPIVNFSLLDIFREAIAWGNLKSWRIGKARIISLLSLLNWAITLVWKKSSIPRTRREWTLAEWRWVGQLIKQARLLGDRSQATKFRGLWIALGRDCLSHSWKKLDSKTREAWLKEINQEARPGGLSKKPKKKKSSKCRPKLGSGVRRS